MEKPYQGRAIVKNNPDYLRITIPGKRSYLFLVFISIWLIALGFISSPDIDQLLHPPNQFNSGFSIMLILFWVYCLVGVAKTIIWEFWGKEIIEVGLGTFSINRKNDLFSREKVYELNECTNFRLRDPESD